MSPVAESLYEQVLNLPEAEQVEFAHRLLESPSDEDDAEWQAELERRMEDVEKHPERLIDGSEVMRQIRSRLAAMRGDVS